MGGEPVESLDRNVLWVMGPQVDASATGEAVPRRDPPPAGEKPLGEFQLNFGVYSASTQQVYFDSQTLWRSGLRSQFPRNVWGDPPVFVTNITSSNRLAVFALSRWSHTTWTGRLTRLLLAEAVLLATHEMGHEGNKDLNKKVAQDEFGRLLESLPESLYGDTAGFDATQLAQREAGMQMAQFEANAADAAVYGLSAFDLGVQTIAGLVRPGDTGDVERYRDKTHALYNYDFHFSDTDLLVGNLAQMMNPMAVVAVYRSLESLFNSEGKIKDVPFFSFFDGTFSISLPETGFNLTPIGPAYSVGLYGRIPHSDGSTSC